MTTPVSKFKLLEFKTTMGFLVANSNSMKKNAEAFLLKTLGGDFLESLGNSLSKSEVYKQGTRTITDTDDLFQGLQIVPRALLSLLVRELSPMQIDDIKEIHIPGMEDTFVRVSKLERDSYSGQVFQRNVKINDFMHRSLPGLGLVLMTVLELYDFDDIEKVPSVSQDQEDKINKIVDDRVQLHSLINQVVDGKMMQRDAVNRLFLNKLNQLYQEHDKIKEEHREIKDDHKELMAQEEPKPSVIVMLKPKKSLPLSDFVENRKKKLGKKEFSIEMAKSETVDCPDCGQNIFNGSGISSCLCFGQDMGRKVFLKKTEDGIKVSFPKSWSTENIEMLLEVLRRKNG